MENSFYKYKKYNKDLLVKKAQLFKWNIDKDEDNTLYLSRDEKFSSLEDLEAKYGSLNIFPMYPFIISIALAFILMTIYLVLFLSKSALGVKTSFIIFCIPAFIFIALAVLLSYLRLKSLTKLGDIENINNNFKKRIEEKLNG